MTDTYLHHPPKKLGEGNVFSRVCLSVCLFARERHATIELHCSGPHWPVPPGHGTSLYRDMRTSLMLTSGGH